MGLFRDNRRRHYVIDPEFQFRYMATWLIITLAFIAVIILGLWWGLRTIGTSETYGLKEVGFMLKIDAAFIILLTIAMEIYLAVLSHRVAGPAWRLEQSLQRMITGDYDFSVRLRKKDYLKRVANGMNDFLNVLREQQGTLKAVLEDMQELKKVISESSISPEAKSLFGKIEEDILKLVSKKKE